MKILLMGNPNVDKSVVFNRVTTLVKELGFVDMLKSAAIAIMVISSLVVGGLLNLVLP